jgi:cytochrome c biogenesis protein CcmG, thiol:disulfide interchange protein DsbE
MAQPDRTSESKKSTSRILFGGALAFILAAGLTSVLLVKGQQTTSTTSVTKAATEIAPVTVTGAVLPDYPEDPNAPDPAVGLAVPVLTGTTLDGNSIMLPVPGKRTLIAVVAHWCPHCQREIPRLVELQRDGKIPPDLNVVLLSTFVDEPRGNYPPSAWLARENSPFPAMADNPNMDGLKALGGMGFPNLHLIGADGKIIARHSGELDPTELLQFVQKQP